MQINNSIPFYIYKCYVNTVADDFISNKTAYESLVLQVLGQFIARAVADDCLSSEFIKRYKGKVESELVR